LVFYLPSTHCATIRSKRASAKGSPDWTYLLFFSPSVSGLAAPELAVARTFGFSFFGFFTSLFPRLLSPFPITSSQVEKPDRRHAGRSDPQENHGCLIRVRAMTLVSSVRCPHSDQRVPWMYDLSAVPQGSEAIGTNNI